MGATRTSLARWALTLAALLLTMAVHAGAWADPGKEAMPSDNATAPADFSARSLDGHARRLGELRGRVTIVAFWATWCFPCRYELPLLHSLYRLHKDAGLQVVAVATQDELPRVRRYVEEQGFTFPVLFDAGHNAMQAFGAASVPATFLLDGSGKPVALTDPATGREGILVDNPLVWTDPATLAHIRALLALP